MSDRDTAPPAAASFDRRGLLRLGGLTVASAAVIAACGRHSDAGQLGRVGVGDTAPAEPDPIVNDGVLLRTAASIELSIAAAYQRMLKDGWLSKSSATFPKLGDRSSLVKQFAGEHSAAADVFNKMAVAAGGDAWTCGNPRLDSAFIDIIFARVEKGTPATSEAKAIPASDDPTRDMINLVHALETLSAAACQALVPQVSQAAYRGPTMQVGARSARRAATTSLAINPGAYVNSNDAELAQPGVTQPAATPAPTTTAAAGGAPPATDIPLPVAVPSQFGSLNQITYISGHGDENGVRLKLQFETPSLNSLTYPFNSCSGKG